MSNTLTYTPGNNSWREHTIPPTDPRLAASILQIIASKAKNEFAAPNIQPATNSIKSPVHVIPIHGTSTTAEGAGPAEMWTISDAA